MANDNSISLPDKIIELSNTLEVDSILSIRQKLILLINELIIKDFHALIQLLYRIDVNEKKIRIYLNENAGDDAAPLLADLIIERQLQKIESRKKFSSGYNKPSEEEKW